MTAEWNPTNDELRAIADNPPSIVPELTVRALARLVLREREAHSRTAQFADRRLTETVQELRAELIAARAGLAAAWREGCFARDAQGDDPEDLPPNPYAPAPPTAPAATPDTEMCRVGHDLYGTCELPYRHTGPHSRIPGGATEPNTWTGTTCQCQPCRETHGPADAPAQPTGARWWPCAHCDSGPRDDDTTLHLCLCSDRCAAPHCNPLPASPGAETKET